MTSNRHEASVNEQQALETPRSDLVDKVSREQAELVDVEDREMETQLFGDYQSGGNVGSQGPACGSEGPLPAESFGGKTQLDSDKDCGFELTHTPADDKLFTQLVQVGMTDFLTKLNCFWQSM